MVKKRNHSRFFIVCSGVAVMLFLAATLPNLAPQVAAATVFLNDGSQLTENSAPPARKIPVLFVHGHDPNPDPSNPNYQKNWWHSLGNLPSFKQTLALPQNACLGIEPYFIYFEDQGRSIALDAADIGDAIDSILARHQPQDPNNPDLKVVIIAYSKGTLSSRTYIKNLHDNNSDIPVSAFIAIAPPNHGLNMPVLPSASLAARQLNNGYGGVTCWSLGADAEDFIADLNGHDIQDTRAANFDPSIDYASEAPGSRPPGSPPQDGVLYVTLYAGDNGDFVGGSTPSDDCQGRVLAKNLADNAVNIDFLEVPGNGPVSVHQNTVHWPQTIFTALYTAVYQQVPPDDVIVGVTGSNPPIIPAPAAQPLDASVVLLFDRSGSMNWGHDGSVNVAEPARRITLAKQAAIPFVWMLNYFNPCGANFAIAAFPRQPQQACEGQIISDLALVQESTIATAIDTTIPGLTPGGSTPLLAGIDTASGLFGNASRKALVLLSDGFQNCPAIAGVEAAQIDQLVDNLNAAAINVHAIGFGQPAEVPHDLLNNIGTGTWGGFYDVTADPNFNPGTWDPGNALQERYKAVLVDTLQLESAADPMAVINSGETQVHDFYISKSDKKVIVYLSWVAFQRDRLLLTVTSSDGQEITLTDPVAGVQTTSGDTFRIIAFESLFLNQPGKVGPVPWQIKVSLADSAEAKNEKYQYSVITRSDLKMNIKFDRKAYQTGDAIVVSASLSEGNQPVRGLQDIGIQVTRPQEGLGNWFAKHPIPLSALKQVPQKQGQEDLSALHRKAIYLTKNSQIPLPQRTRPEPVQMVDDQSHGDAKANDGVYTARFSDTRQQGTYVFYVQTSGTTGDGILFKREKVIEKYVTINVDPTSTAVEAARQPAIEQDVKAYEIRVTPKDALGNFLGPGHAGSMKLEASEGRWMGSLQDRLDGTYTHILSVPHDVEPQALNLNLSIRNTAIPFRLADKLFEPETRHPFEEWYLFVVLVLLMGVLVAVWIKGR
ncbi:MAG: VWA domain-containing protein [Desulfobacterales bacterium]|jgi:hypothetical protein